MLSPLKVTVREDYFCVVSQCFTYLLINNRLCVGPLQLEHRKHLTDTTETRDEVMIPNGSSSCSACL